MTPLNYVHLSALTSNMHSESMGGLNNITYKTEKQTAINYQEYKFSKITVLLCNALHKYSTHRNLSTFWRIKT